MLLPMGLPEDVSVIAWGLSLERWTPTHYAHRNTPWISFIRTEHKLCSVLSVILTVLNVPPFYPAGAFENGSISPYLVANLSDFPFVTLYDSVCLQTSSVWIHWAHIWPTFHIFSFVVWRWIFLFMNDFTVLLTSFTEIISCWILDFICHCRHFGYLQPIENL